MILRAIFDFISLRQFANHKGKNREFVFHFLVHVNFKKLTFQNDITKIYGGFAKNIEYQK